MIKNLKILFGFFLTIVFFRYIPHLPNFTPVLAMTFYGTIIFGRSSLIYILLAYAISDLFIGFHSLTLFTWGSVIIISFVSKFFLSTMISRISGSLLGAFIFFVLTNFGVWIFGNYDFTINGLFLCYTLALPFFAHSLISTFIFSCLI